MHITAKKDQLAEALFKAQAALELIAVASQSEEFSLSREACQKLAKDTLAAMSDILQEKRSKSDSSLSSDGENDRKLLLAAQSLSANRPITVFSDGGCKGNPGPAGWAAVIVQDGQVKQESHAYIGVATNQVAELSAAINGLALTPAGSVVELVSDSQYVLKGISEWRKGWLARGWVNSKGEPVANKALWVELYAQVDKRKVTTRWVRGHSGNVFNERCDELATKAIELKVQAPSFEPLPTVAKASLF